MLVFGVDETTITTTTHPPTLPSIHTSTPTSPPIIRTYPHTHPDAPLDLAVRLLDELPQRPLQRALVVPLVRERAALPLVDGRVELLLELVLVGVLAGALFGGGVWF